MSWRHYNASLLNYNDLVGYPLPNARGELDFVRTPASIWDAEIVFFDEISRCRPDLQNKLFPILHERRVQGLPLEKLRYRWAAMNPPATEDDLEESLYRGSEPLDAALADRFAFVVAMPQWRDFSAEAQERLIVAAQQNVAPEAGLRLRQVVEEGRRDLPELTASHGGRLARYVRFVVDLLQQAGIELSSRRAALLCRNILAVHAARRALEAEPKLADSAWLALEHSLPHPAYGPRPAVTKLLVAHRQAWDVAGVPEDDPRSRLWQQRDPLLRALAAGRISSLSGEEFSGIVADALAELPLVSRHVWRGDSLRRERSGDWPRPWPSRSRLSTRN